MEALKGAKRAGAAAAPEPRGSLRARGRGADASCCPLCAAAPLPGPRQLAVSPRCSCPVHKTARVQHGACRPRDVPGARASAARLLGAEGWAWCQNTTPAVKSPMRVVGRCFLRAAYQGCVSLEAAEGGAVPKIRPWEPIGRRMDTSRWMSADT